MATNDHTGCAFLRLAPGMALQAYISDFGEDCVLQSVSREVATVKLTKGGRVRRVLIEDLIINPRGEDLVFSPPSAAMAVEGGGA